MIYFVSLFAFAEAQKQNPPNQHAGNTKSDDSDAWVFVVYIAVFIGSIPVIYLLYLLWFRCCRVDPVAAIFKRFPVFKFVPGGESGFGATQCRICLTDFADGERLRILPCGHMYHGKCLKQLVTSGSMTCPDCRHNFGNNSA
ncbi:hypothetical protein FH972_001131 [Carpinus fangiana]|uniref:RING-type domain-containing protein n=1 Tax=Carpinus fangiana TaxID=176857 RepID=A0A5N6QAS7_9ROSI|nr:hypothetical protein FH972_001131 [Carpinus fangiana]